MDINQKLPVKTPGFIGGKALFSLPVSIHRLRHVCKMFAFTPLLHIFYHSAPGI